MGLMGTLTLVPQPWSLSCHENRNSLSEVSPRGHGSTSAPLQPVCHVLGTRGLNMEITWSLSSAFPSPQTESTINHPGSQARYLGALDSAPSRHQPISYRSCHLFFLLLPTPQPTPRLPEWSQASQSCADLKAGFFQSIPPPSMQEQSDFS